MKDIKRAYRSKALKLHPDVSKAPNAKEQFMECKQAYQELLDGMGSNGQSGQSGSRSRRANDGKGQNGRPSSSYGSYSSSPSSSSSYFRDNQEREKEEFYGLSDLFRDLEDEWQKTRPASGEPKSLWEELADIGEEFVEFLEKNLPVAEADVSDSSRRPASPPPAQPKEKTSKTVDDELAEMKRRMGL